MTRISYMVGVDFGSKDKVAVVLMREDPSTDTVFVDGAWAAEDIHTAWRVALKLATRSLPWWKRLWRIMRYTNAMSRAKVVP